MIRLRKDNEIILRNYIEELEELFKNDISGPLTKLKINKEQIHKNLQLYYNIKRDTRSMEKYYRSLAYLSLPSEQLYKKYQELVTITHTVRNPYYISKDQYLYTWVDLQPDGSVKSIYSGEYEDPQKMIEEDFQTIKIKHKEFQWLLQNKDQDNGLLAKMDNIHFVFKYNTEHIVPQSWYGSREPMKGDLHHLFVCSPKCNATRSNYPYEDFSFYVPESPQEKIQNRCGVATGGRFEPEDGKGAVARAMLYFLLRYPKAIKRSFKRQIDLDLLLNWHQEFDVSLYEKHRNQAIFRIQGNRNPFIDLPELAEKIVDYLF